MFMLYRYVLAQQMSLGTGTSGHLLKEKETVVLGFWQLDPGKIHIRMAVEMYSFNCLHDNSWRSSSSFSCVNKSYVSKQFVCNYVLVGDLRNFIQKKSRLKALKVSKPHILNTLEAQAFFFFDKKIAMPQTTLGSWWVSPVPFFLLWSPDHSMDLSLCLIIWSLH